MFEDGLWDFSQVIGLPTQMSPSVRRLDFTAITNTGWQLVAKELILAMLAPRHDAVALLPRANRSPIHLRSAHGRLGELTRWLNWLSDHGIRYLSEVDDDCCQAYLVHRRYVYDDAGIRVGERGPSIRRAAAMVPIDLLNYRDLFTGDRVPAGLRPWGAASPSAVAEMLSGRLENKTPPVPDALLQAMVANALYLVTVIGPHAAALVSQLRQTPSWSLRRWGRGQPRPQRKDLTEVLAEYTAAGTPLPQLPDHNVRDRIRAGWQADDPLISVALDQLARQAGHVQFNPDWLPQLRPALERTLAQVGAQRLLGREARLVQRANDDTALPWTVPLDQLQAIALVGIVRTAAITLIAAVTGMRASELMELKVGCRRPPEHHGPDLVRYRVAGTVVKGQPLGGIHDEWVVIEPVYQAIGLLEQLHDDPVDGTPLVGRFAFDVRHKWLRNWVNGPAGQRLGLTVIPDSPINLRMLRRTLAIELAYRPGGVLAAKLHLKHISVATTEGYASRPGGAQAELLAEISKHEDERNLDLLWAEFRNWRNGILPAGPGARDLTELFSHIDGKLSTQDADAPKVQRNDREILNLLSKRASTLHLGTANYCWFTDPAKALCLRGRLIYTFCISRCLAR